MDAGRACRPHFFEVLRVQGHVLRAVMLRDVRTRFFGTALGFIVMILWPLTHIVALLLIYTGMGRVAPYGQSVALWFATGVIPFMAFSYVSRFCVLGIVTNKPLLTLPIIRVTDIMFARVILEILSAVIVVIVMMISFWVCGIDFNPIDIIEAVKAFAAAVLLGVGFGIFHSIIAAFLPMWFTAYSLATIVFWIASGVFYVPDALPERAVYWMSYNPILQCVEWMRSAYYEGYGVHILDRNYTIAWAVGSVFAGLVLERLVRGKILAG
jgi:capsular polysaccharide transport system permease protein